MENKITIVIKYKGDKAKDFVKEMYDLNIVNQIRNEKGNLRYEYFIPYEKDNYVLLIDSWINQEALDKHHNSPLMEQISKLREKYDLHMEVTKYQELVDNLDNKFIRK